MPNWAMNKLEVTGKPENLRAFLNACVVDRETRDYDADTKSLKTVVKPLFSLHGIVPMPEVLEDTRSPYATSRMLRDAIQREVPVFPEFPVCDDLSEDSLEQAKMIWDHFTAHYSEVAEEKTWLLSLFKEIEGNLRAFQETGYSNWYEWCVDHWGTKWDVSDDSTRIEDENLDNGHLTVTFDTAWSAPEIWFKKAVEAYPSLSFALFACDPAMDWHIEIRGFDGGLTEYLPATAREMADFWGIEDMYADEEEEDEEEVPV